MKRIALVGAAVTIFTALAGISLAKAQGTAFTYQGRLSTGSASAEGLYEMQFALFDSATNGNPIGAPIAIAPVTVSNGLFTVILDFESTPFVSGNLRWLEITVNGYGSQTPAVTLAPRQKVTATPYAITAGSVASGGLAAGNYPNPVIFGNATNQFHGTFTGNGLALTNVNASTLGGLSSSNFWQLNGNAGTTADTHFIGTTDDQPLEVKVNGTRALRLEPNSSGAPNVVGGANRNAVGPGIVGATVGGGGARNYLGAVYTNRVDGDFGTVAGGAQNAIQTGSFAGVVAGGFRNIIQASSSSTIGGGGNNTIESNSGRSAIAGGHRNRIFQDSYYSAVGGGEDNWILSPYGAIGGGSLNTIRSNAVYATIPGGLLNSAAEYGFAAGRQANADHPGAFVWGDSTEADVRSTNANSVTFRATGGVRMISATDIDGNPSAGVALASGSGSWSSLSDRAAKENFTRSDRGEILEKVAALPIATWNYKTQDKSVRHIGPTAQDFHAAFGLGENDRTISGVDADGIALAAIQGLDGKLEEQLSAKEREIESLRARSEALEQRVHRLEELLMNMERARTVAP